MLQRAASNAYSWWWASHIRTKQSKWIEQNLHDMEERVHYVLKLLEEEGDTFAKRAEMYYKRRPELINFVEESYRSFRALAERYDHLSTELQSANNKIASYFPEEVQFQMDDDDECGMPTKPDKIPQEPKPNVPKAPTRNLKALITTASKQIKGNKPEQTTKVVAKSGLTKNEALEEIDKLQKEILGLQTVKEFVKNSYESGLSKYWKIENQIMEQQQKVCRLQDEFGVGVSIEDKDALTLMADTALKSCQESLSQLQEMQENSSNEAKSENKRIGEACERLTLLKKFFFPDQIDGEENVETHESEKARATSVISNEEVCKEEEEEMEQLKEKIKEHIEAASKGPFTVTILSDKIDELMSKVFSLENAVSSQTALINRLKSETDELQAQIRTLEADKAALKDDAEKLREMLHELEKKLHEIHDLNQKVESRNSSLKTDFTEATCNLDHLSNKIKTVKPDEDPEDEDLLAEEKKLLVEIESKEELKTEKDVPSEDNLEGRSTKASVEVEKPKDPKPIEAEIPMQEPSPATSESKLKTSPKKSAAEKDDATNWRMMLLNNLDNREKILLAEYTSILRGYKDAKKNLNEVERKNKDSHFEMTLLVRQLRSRVAKRDSEIQSLRDQLQQQQKSSGGGKDQMIEVSSVSRTLNVQCSIPEDKTENLASKEEEEIKLILVDQPKNISKTEEKLQTKIDALTEDKMDIWLRFSTSFQQIKKFKSEVKDLQDEIWKAKNKKQEENKKEKEKDRLSNSTHIKSDIRPIYKHLRDIETELALWANRSALLNDELEHRSSSLNNIQEEIEAALEEGGLKDDDINFSSHQAAKFQGEVLNMQQESNKIREELETGRDSMTMLRLDVGKTLENLEQEFVFSSSKDHNQPQASDNQPKVPLKSFISGNRYKKHKQSIFSLVNPKLYRKYHNLKF